jgi:hypothetical protein
MVDPNEFDWNQVDWEGLYPRLVLYAAGKLRRLTWRGKRSGHIPEGRMAPDFAQEAILKTMDGTRKWNRGEDSLFDHLTGVISSLISHLVDSKENQTTTSTDDTIVNIEDYLPTPEMAVLRKIQEEHYLAYLEEKDPLLNKLARLILCESVRSTAEFSVRLDASIAKVESLKKCLYRTTRRYVEEMQDKAIGKGGDLKGVANDS